MNFLTIDTTTSVCILGLYYQQQFTAIQQTNARQHAANILPQIDHLLQNQTCPLTALDGIIVSCGPGSFTGVRLGISVAQGLAYGIDCPIVPLNSLQVLAQSAYQQQFDATHIAVAVTARKDQCYWQTFTVDKNAIMQPDHPSQVRDISQLTAPANNTLAIGDAWPTITQSTETGVIHIQPSAHALLQLGQSAWQQGKQVAAMDVSAQYILTDLYQPKARQQDSDVG